MGVTMKSKTVGFDVISCEMLFSEGKTRQDILNSVCFMRAASADTHPPKEPTHTHKHRRTYTSQPWADDKKIKAANAYVNRYVSYIRTHCIYSCLQVKTCDLILYSWKCSSRKMCVDLLACTVSGGDTFSHLTYFCYFLPPAKQCSPQERPVKTLSGI